MKCFLVKKTAALLGYKRGNKYICENKQTSYILL